MPILHELPGFSSSDAAHRRLRPQHRQSLKRTIAGVLSALLALFILLPGQVSAATDQVCQVAPGGSIQAEINNPACDTIEIPDGTFTENLTINRTVTLQGAGNTSTILDGGGNSRVLTIDGAGITVRLHDLRVTGGDASNTSQSVSIHRLGGGILADNGATLYLESVRVDNNLGFAGATRGAFGGGVAIVRGSTAHVLDSYLENNIASGGPRTGFGGGLAIAAGSAYITNTVVAGNQGNFRPGSLSGNGTGGGLYAAGITGSGQAVMVVWDSTVRDNVAANAEGGGDGSGGGLRVGSSEDTRVTVINTLFENNMAAGSNASGDVGEGGGIAITAGSNPSYLTVEDSVLRGNYANARMDIESGANNARGGGIYADPGSSDGLISVTLTNTDLIENMAKAGTGPGDGQGGGIFARRAAISIHGGTLQGNIAGANNAAKGLGGAIRISGVGPTPLTVERAELLDNVARIGSAAGGAGQGGGIQLSGSGAVFTVTNTILGDNRAGSTSGGDGAGIYVGSSAAGTVVHATVAAEELTPAHGIYKIGAGSIAITNTIVANYSTGIHNATGPGAVTAAYILFSGNTDDTGGSVPGAQQFTGDPMFVNPAMRNYRIQEGSAARNAGIDAGIAVDIDGDMRPQDTGFDIGADEYAQTPISSVEIDGPSSVVASQTYTYTALVSPSNAHMPISYDWQPMPENTIGNQATYSWTMTGTQIITVTASNIAGSVTATRTVIVQSQPITVTGLSISGPTSGSINLPYSFDATVSPAESSAPITYTWSPMPGTGQGTATASYTWGSPGVETITATAQNVGETVTATHSITIEAVAVSGASISGPSSGAPGEFYEYSASVSPSNASTPIMYTWSPDPDSGQGTSLAGYIWPETGTQNIEVTVANDYGTAVATRTVSIEEIGVSGVSIDGPSNVTVDQPNSYSAMVSPSNATLPVEYTWSPAPDSGQGTANADYTWSTPGTNVITVTAQNLQGTASAVSTRTVTVSGEEIGVVGASIAGPSNVVVDQLYNYTGTVTPMNATSPITYTWSPTPNEGQGTSQVQYAWSEPGSRTITLTAENNAGSAVMTRMVNVSEQPVAPTGVEITGPITGTVTTSYSYTATVSPSNATEPLNYTWAPMPDSGQGTPHAAYSWETPGAKTISVTVQNDEGTVSDTRTVNITEAQPGPEPDHVIEVGNDFFSPQSLTIEVGETVTWQRLEGIHNVRADDSSFGNDLSGTWDTYTYTFNEPGTYAYYCESHGGPGGVGMSGVIIVEDPSEPDPDDDKLYIPSVERDHDQ